MSKKPRRGAPAQGMARRKAKRVPANYKSRIITERYAILREALIAYGMDRERSAELGERLRDIHNTYWLATTDFSHILHRCTKGAQCSHPVSRHANARSLNVHVGKLDDLYARLDEECLNDLEHIVAQTPEIVEAAIQDKNLGTIETKRLLNFRSTLPIIIGDAQRVVDEHTSGFPVGFLKIIAEGILGMNGSMAEAFSDNLYTKLVNESASDSFRKAAARHRENNEQPNYIEYMRLGQLSVPDRSWLTNEIEHYQRLGRGGMLEQDLPWASQVLDASADRQFTTSLLGMTDSGWPKLHEVYQDDISRAAQFAEQHGERSDLLHHLVKTVNLDIDSAEHIVTTVQTGAHADRVSNSLQNIRGASEAIAEAYRLCPELFINGVDLVKLLEGKQNTTKVRKYAEYRSAPAKRAALLEFSIRYPKEKIRGLINLLDECPNALVLDAITGSGDIKTAIEFMRNKQDIVDPYAQLRGSTEFDVVSRYLDRGLLERTESVYRACAQLRQLRPGAVRDTLVRHPLLMARFLAEADQSTTATINTRIVEQQHTFSEDPYKELYRLYYPSSPVMVANGFEQIEEQPIKRVVFVGDRLRSHDAQDVATRLGLDYVQLSQTDGLKRFSQLIQPSDAVAYYVEQCGHTHSGHVKWMAQQAGAMWIELRYTNPTRIHRTISDKLHAIQSP